MKTKGLLLVSLMTIFIHAQTIKQHTPKTQSETLHKKHLYEALITRPISEAEMTEVLKYGDEIVPSDITGTVMIDGTIPAAGGTTGGGATSFGYTICPYTGSCSTQTDAEHFYSGRYKKFLDALYQQYRLRMLGGD